MPALRTNIEAEEDVLVGGRGRDTSTHPGDEGWEGWMDGQTGGRKGRYSPLRAGAQPFSPITAERD